MTRRHTDQEIARAASRFDQLAAGLEMSLAEVDNTEDLQAVAEASEAVSSDEQRLRDAVHTARARGRSWNEIGVALGVSRQAARQRFVEKSPA